MQIDPDNLNTPILTPEVIAQILKTGKWAEDPALTLVTNDADIAETAKAAKQWIAGWNAASILYQSTTVPRYWEGTQVERANLPFYTVAKAVNSLTPQIVNGLFYDDPPFVLQQRPGTTQDTVDAVSDIIGYQLKEIKFKEEVRRGVINATLFGTNIWKYGWDKYTKTRTYYKLDEDSQTIPSDIPGQPDVEFHEPDPALVEHTEEIHICQPRFENITSIRDVMVDPTLRTPDIREAKYVIHRMYMTFNDLEKLRDVPGYDIPTRQEVMEWFLPPAEDAIPALDERTGLNPVWDLRANPRWDIATEDPFNQPLEVLERWDNEKLIIVIQRKKVICNSPNQYGKIPFYSINWWDVPSAFYGLGLGRTIGAEQRLQQGIVNTWLDSTALALAGVYARKRGKSNFTQNFRIHPGRVIEIDEKGDIEPLDRPPAVPEAGTHLGLSAARVEQNSGAGEISSQGSAGSTGHSNLARTAAGANAITAGQGVAIGEFIEKFCTQVFIPWLYDLHELNKNLLPASVIKQILNDKLQSPYLNGGGSIDQIRSSIVSFSAEAGAKLNDRRAMASSLPLLTSFLSQQFIIQALAQEGLKVDTKQVINTMFQAAGFKNFFDIIIPMTPEEAQAAKENQPAAMQQKQLQAQAALAQQKYEANERLADQQNMGKAANEIIRNEIEHTGTSTALTGTPSNVGFGEGDLYGGEGP